MGRWWEDGRYCCGDVDLGRWEGLGVMRAVVGMSTIDWFLLWLLVFYLERNS